MPGLQELDNFARSYGLAVAILVAGAGSYVAAVIALWRENRRLHETLERVLEERTKTLDALLAASFRRDRA